MAEVTNDLNKAISSNIELINSLEQHNNSLTKLIKNLRILSKRISISIARIFTSQISLAIFYWLYRKYLKITRFTFFANIASVIFYCIHFCRNYYPELLILFGLLYPSFTLLITLFESSLMQFLIFLLPILLFNTLCVLTVFYYIEKHETGEKITLQKSVLICFKKMFSIITVFFLNISLIFEFIILFIFSDLFLSLLFKTGWEHSFIYWTLTSFFFLIIFYIIFILNIIFSQALFSVILDEISPYEAVLGSINLVKKNFPLFICLHFILFLVFSYLIYFASINLFETGFIIILILYYQTAILLNYLFKITLFKKSNESQISQINISSPFKFLFTLFCLFGIPSIMIFNSLAFAVHPQIIKFIAQQQENILAMRDMTTYKDASQGFSIAYPKQWIVYHWNDASVTFYTNDTGTSGSGIWVSVTVDSLYNSRFTELYYSNPGIVSNTTGNKDITSKVSNIILQGYETVKYLYIKQGDSYTEYQTHYLLHKADKTFDINFTTNSQDTLSQNSQIFDRIISTFKLTK
jgi:hypothetical protein